MIKHNPLEIIIWFDTGKNAELLRLASFRPIRIFIPVEENLTRKIEINLKKDVILDIGTVPKDSAGSPVAVSAIQPYVSNQFATSTGVYGTFANISSPAAQRYTATFVPTGKINGSLNFTGVTDYVDVPHHHKLM
jgi:hypothetical protein